jgi:D-alanyl-D-alanine carboxypeptidase
MFAPARLPVRPGWLPVTLAVLMLLGAAYRIGATRGAAPAVTVRAVAASAQPVNAEAVTGVLPAESDAPSTRANNPGTGAGTVTPGPWGAPPLLRPDAPPPPRAGALSALVLDEASAAVLFESEARRRLPPASLTKIAAAVVALRAGRLDDEAVSDVDGFMMRGSTIMGLYAGDRLSRRDLLYGLMLPSGNDAALALGRNVAGSDDAFVARMNALVEELGLRDTRFDTPHGLGRTGYSSAYDLAMLSRYAMQQPGFAEIVQSTTWRVNGSRTYNVHNVNPFLFNFAGADGVKTGFTNSAGKTIVASATRDGHRLYAVLLNDPATTTDASALLDWAFRAHTWTSTAEAPAGSTITSARTGSLAPR